MMTPVEHGEDSIGDSSEVQCIAMVIFVGRDVRGRKGIYGTGN